jgi:hypothetical protein
MSLRGHIEAAPVGFLLWALGFNRFERQWFDGKGVGAETGQFYAARLLPAHSFQLGAQGLHG